MNFTPFGGSFTSVPTQFTTTTKFPQNVAAQAGQMQPTFLQLPITIAGSKPGDPPQQQMLQIQLVTPTNQPIGTISLADNSQPKYQLAPIALQNFAAGNATVLHLAYNNPQGETVELPLPQLVPTSQPAEQGSSVENGEAHCNNNNNNQTQQIHIQTQVDEDDMDKSTQTSGKNTITIAQVKVEKDKGCYQEQEHYVELPANWQSLTSQGSIVSVADCLSKLPAHNLSTFIKLSADSIKREQELEDSPLSAQSAEAITGELVTTVEEDPLAHDCQTTEMTVNPDGTTTQIVVMTHGEKKNTKVKKKYKKKPPKERRQMPGRVIISTDDDGTKQYHCPECVVRCTEMDLLEQHLALHKTERRFICDMCGAALKRKEHLERHKLGHNPERPYTCNTCYKGFKRKEHLNLHVVIHSGEKTQVCTECGKGFYRKDHLRKHARSHLTKKIKEEAGLVPLVQLQEQGHVTTVQDGQLVTAEQAQTLNDGTRVLMIVPDHGDVSQDASLEGHQHHLEATVILPSGVETSTMAIMQQAAAQHH